MENTNVKEQVVNNENQQVAQELRDLNEFQLALIGGGIGDVHFG